MQTEFSKTRRATMTKGITRAREAVRKFKINEVCSLEIIFVFSVIFYIGF